MTEPLSRCIYCGVTSDWEEAFVDASTFRNGPGKACVTCKAYRDKFQGFYINVAIASIVFLVIGYHTTGSATGAVAFALIAYVAAYAAIALHELAHAAAATLVGVGVPVFSIGGGRQVRVSRTATRWLLLGFTPSEGLIILSYPSGNGYRMKSAFISAAGPLFNLACAGAVYAWLKQYEGALPTYPELTAQLFVIFNVLLGVANLLPFQASTPYGVMSSDGRSILEAFAMTDEQVDEAVGQTLFVVAYFEYLFGSKAAVVEMVEPVIESGSADIAMKILASAAYAETGNLDKGIRLCRAALEVDVLDRGQRAALLNNLAYALQFKEAPDALDEAEQLSSEAYSLCPMALAIRSTRALVLVAIDREREALALTRDRRFKIEPKPTQAKVLCTQAMAYAKLGEIERAAESLAAATRLAPDSDRVARTRAELAEQAAA